jgi:NADPH:quinone reductase
MRTMKAVVLNEPGPVENLNIVEMPIPDPQPGYFSADHRD